MAYRFTKKGKYDLLLTNIYCYDTYLSSALGSGMENASTHNQLAVRAARIPIVHLDIVVVSGL